MDPLDPAARFLVPKLVSLASPPQLGGQFGVVAPQTQVHRSRFEQVPGPQEDLGLIERLGHEIHGAGGQRPISGLLCRVRGEDDYREVLVGGNHARERLEDGETIQMGHVEVQQHQIGHDLLEGGQHLAGVGHAMKLNHAGPTEDLPKQFDVGLLVVDDQHDRLGQVSQRERLRQAGRAAHALGVWRHRWPYRHTQCRT